SSHHICRESDCELRVQSGTRVIKFASVLRFRRSLRSVRQTWANFGIGTLAPNGRFDMTTERESRELTQVGPGTIMGDLMRRYWLPAARSSELERDGAPVRLMLLGEKLIAFRDSAGRVGVMDHRCPHRCASLFLGRNEEGGIRCIYHGWKYD